MPKGILKKSGRRIDKKNAQVNQNTVNTGVKFNNEVKEGFTKEEIAQIIARHKEVVEGMNKYLPDDQKIAVDPKLEEKLHDPKLAKMYHLGQEIKNREKKQKELYEEVRNKYGSAKAAFNIYGSLRTGGSQQDKTYNEQVYRNYKDDPQKFIYKQYKNILNTTGKELYELGDDPIKQAEYYLNNYEKCTYASNMTSVVENNANKDIFSEEFKANVKSAGSLAHNIYQTKYAVASFDSIDKLAFPTLNEKQINTLYDSTYSSENRDKEDINNCLRNAKYGWGKEPSPKENFDKIKQATGVDLSNEKNFITKNVFLDKNGKAMSVEGIANGEKVKDFGSAKEISDPNQKRDFNFITNDFKKAYMENWKAKFNEKRGVEGKNLNIKAIEEAHKGGFLNRLFRRPSKEYKDMMAAFKNYNDPESKDYMNKEKLDEKTQAYVDHKAASGKELKGADKIRTDFAKNILDTNKEANNIFKQTENAITGQVAQKRVTFLLPEDVNVEVVSNEKEHVVIKINEGPSQSNEKDQEIEL